MIVSKTIEPLFTDFIAQLRDKNRIKLVPFDKKEWFRGAYSTIQRTLRDGYAPLTVTEKTLCTNALFREIPKLSGQHFDSNLESLVIKTAQNHKLSIGHAQKLISILMKYAAACHKQQDGNVPDVLKSLVQTEFDRLPVPIDAIVLFQLKKLHPNKFIDVKSGSGIDKKGRPYYWAKIMTRNDPEAWSRISEYETYWSIQERIRQLAKAMSMKPLEFEMKNLWVKK